MKILDLIKIDVPNGYYGRHEYKCADGTLILFDEVSGLARNVKYLAYVDCLCEHIDKTSIVEESAWMHKKYLAELQDHIDSWGTDEDERQFKAFKEA